MDTSIQYLYRLFDKEGTLLYIGVTDNLSRRIAEHSRKPWGPEIADISSELVLGRQKALDREAKTVERERPLHNRYLKGLSITHFRSKELREDEKHFNEQFGKRLQEAQLSAGLSDAEFTAELKCSKHELKLYKAGVRAPNAYRFYLMTEVLNVSGDWLVGRTESPMPAA